MASNLYGFEKRKSFKAVTAVEVIAISVLAVAVIAILSFFIFFKDNTAHKFFGNYIYLSNVSSMDPAIPLGAAVFADPDVLPVPGEAALCTVEIDNEKYTTILRVQDIQPEEGTTYYILRGDANAANETIRIPESGILAKCATYSVFFGAILSFSISQLGLLTGIILPCLLAIVIQVLRIMRINKYESDDEDDEEYDYDDEEEFETDDVVFSTLKQSPAPPVYSEPEPPVKKLYVGGEGKAEYIRSAAPTAGYSELHETMRRQTSPLRSSSPASAGLHAQRGTVNDNFREKPTSRTSEAASEIYFERPQRNTYNHPTENLYERPRMYYDKPAASPETYLEPPAVKNPVDVTIPLDAVKPRETIAPPPKQTNNKTLEELMRVIDNAQNTMRK